MTENNTINTTIVIPAYNESDTINKLLDNICLKATLVPNEIIIVDANSNDDTNSKIYKWKSLNPEYNVKILHSNCITFPGKARNLGIKSSKNDYIVFIDCGIIPSTNWLEKLVKPIINDSSVEVVWGNSEAMADTDLERIFAYIVEPSKIEKRKIVPNMCIKKSCIFQIGLFHEELRAGEDILFKELIKKNKLNEVFTDAKSYYSGYPKNFYEAYKKWAIYAEYEVKADIYQKKLKFILLQIITFCILFLFFSDFFNYLYSIIFASCSITLSMLFFIKRENNYKIFGIKEHLIAFLLLMFINIGRANGIFKGLLKYKLSNNYSKV